ncbi:hypothetical protein AURDEDRAFT_173032 [Auricularia subglabra TFB-10046 SS5]|uniref:Uncharacterized protein n=1 Tax=Auricularia subglabra (strain TFB-10046 / SS5) TaxID=717982 RepID=J0WV00_AURST|nr:hypothetical protein AURDEDRAFT_173032 [Auricularia subglabra TFB-10046 SS5]
MFLLGAIKLPISSSTTFPARPYATTIKSQYAAILQPQCFPSILARTTCSSTSVSWSSPPRYSRISLLGPKDIEATYALLASYAVFPDNASMVTELAIDTKGWLARRFRRPDRNLAKPPSLPPFDDAAHEVLEQRIRNIGMSRQSTDDMLGSLLWKKARLLGQESVSPDDEEHKYLQYAETAAVLLLSFCGNITCFYAGEMASHPSPLQEYLHKSNYGLIPAAHRALQNLESVTVGPTSASSPYYDERMYHTTEYLDYLSLFHRLPRFASLTLDGTGEYQARRQVFPPGTSSPSFKRIQMRHTDISGALLGTILRVPVGLEEFVLSIGGLWAHDGGEPVIQLKTLAKCLLTQRETLRVLDLDLGGTVLASPPLAGQHEAEATREDYGLFGLTDDEIERDEYFVLDEAAGTGPLLAHDLPDTRKYGYTIGSLHDFAALTHLSINIRALMGPDSGYTAPSSLAEQPPFRLVEALPPSLEYLCLYDYERGENKNIDEHVDELLEKKGELLPRLKVVEGVDEKHVGEGWKHALGPDEEQLWEREYPDLGWVEVA